MEVGQPAAPAPTTAIAAARAALRPAASAIPRRSGSRRCARASRGTTAKPMAWRSTRRASSSRPARRPGSSWRFSRCSRRAIGSRSRCPATRLIATSSGARLRAGGDRDHAGDALGDHARDADRGAPQGAAQRRADREPRQSDRHHDDGPGAARSDRRRGRRGHPLHLRRDLSRPRLCVRGRDRGAALRRRRDHQLVLQIFLHDRLAHRLDGAAGAAGPFDRPAAGQSGHFSADAVPDRRRGGVRRPRRDGSGQARLRGEPAHPARRLAEGGPRANPACRWRLLSLCRRVALLRRQLRIRQAHAGGDACGGHARRRFRSAAGPTFIRLCYAGSAAEMRERSRGSARGSRLDRRSVFFLLPKAPYL